MKPEDKELLLKDLCARLPYGVKFKWCDNFHTDYYTLIGINEGQIIGRNVNQDDCLFFRGEDKIKPYLRPMSSMSEKERLMYEGLMIGTNNVSYMLDVIDWLNKKMFDFRGLIDKGLAIEVTEENNPYKD